MAVDIIARGMAVRGGGSGGESYTKDETDALLAQKQNTLVSGGNIKTINGESVLGSGDIAIKSYHTFNNSWVTNSTTAAFCDSIVNDQTAIAGMSYLGQLRCSDLPGDLGQGEAIVEIISESEDGKAIHITLTSVDTEPYKWEYERAIVNGHYVTPGWIGYQPEITVNNKLDADLVEGNLQYKHIVEAQLVGEDMGIYENNHLYFTVRNFSDTQITTFAQLLSNYENYETIAVYNLEMNSTNLCITRTSEEEASYNGEGSTPVDVDPDNIVILSDTVKRIN